MNRTPAAVTAVLALALAAAAPAGAATSVPYRGKTKGGNTITFKRTGAKIGALESMVPTICLSSTGGTGDSKAGADPYMPPGAFTIGQTVKRKALQMTAFYPAKVTKNYTVTTQAGKGGKVTGKLDENFSYAIPWLDPWSGQTSLRIYICRGVTTFSAGPVK